MDEKVDDESEDTSTVLNVYIMCVCIFMNVCVYGLRGSVYDSCKTRPSWTLTHCSCFYSSWDFVVEKSIYTSDNIFFCLLYCMCIFPVGSSVQHEM